MMIKKISARVAILFAAIAVFSTCTCPTQAEIPESNRYNVLLICVDDLRPELGCYGETVIKSPNIDKLAETGRCFMRHFVQVPTCGASRYALLTGRRTSESGGSGNGAFTGGSSGLKREPQTSGAQTLPEIFRRSGYTTAMIGKISHQPDGRVFGYNASGDGREEMPGAWDRYLTPYGQWKRGWGIFFAYADGRHREDRSGYRPVMEFTAEKDTDLPDGLLAEAAIDAIDDLAANKSDQPFFLAVGFFKPHLPFVAPKPYWDMYEGVDIPAVPNPTGTSGYGHGSGECFKYQFPFDKSARPLSAEKARQLKQAYYACVSYVDVQIGKVLDQLEKSGLADNTVVALWGDHGWHLGEHAVWGKHTPLERSLRSPLIIRVPGMKQPGRSTDALCETVDILPTLVDVCRPTKPQSCFKLGGTSLAPALADPSATVKDAAYGYWSGRTVRTDRYRLIAKPAGGDGYKSIELYDHQEDPLETKNIADDNPELTEQLLKKLGEG